MNDLDTALRATYQARSHTPEPPDLLEKVLDIPDLDVPQPRRVLPPTTGRFQSMFSAAKFMLAGAIVALFGGLLLAGFLARPSDEPAPAAVIDSPSPATTEALLSSMTTEEVEPGVFRVIDDGLRELVAEAEIPSHTHGDPVGGADIVAGLDGSVWWFGPDRFFRLGDERTHAVPWPEGETMTGPRYLEVAPDGTLWSFRHHYDDPEPESVLTSFDGRSWTTHDDALPDGLLPHPLGSMEVRSDGSIWVTRVGGAARLIDDGWERMPGSLPSFWGGIRQGDRLMHLGVDEVTGGYRLDDSAWREHSAPAGIFDGESGPNGQLWVAYMEAVGFNDIDHLALFDDDGWRTFDTGPDVGSSGPYETGPRTFEVAPDGSVWFRPGSRSFEGCDGIANFDGESLGQHLRGLCIYTADVAPDGHVWVVAGPTPYLMHAYVITPVAVAGARS